MRKGAIPVENQKKCSNCGQPIQPGDKFCPNCGRPFEERFSEAPPPIPPTPPIPPLELASPEPEIPTPPEIKFVAWEEREIIGFFKALWETWKESVFNPDKFFSHMPFSGGLGSPLLYALIICYISFLVGQIYSWVFSSFWLGMLSRYIEREDILMGLAARGGSGIVSLFLAPIFIIIFIFIASGIYHLIGMIFGWAKRDFEATLRTVAYGTGPVIFGIIPLCGSPIGTVWAIVLTIIGYKHMQQTTGGKASFVILLPLILCCCLAVILGLIFSAAIMALIGKAMNSGYNFN
jgi:hypothetical protein